MSRQADIQPWTAHSDNRTIWADFSFFFGFSPDHIGVSALFLLQTHGFDTFVLVCCNIYERSWAHSWGLTGCTAVIRAESLFCFCGIKMITRNKLVTGRLPFIAWQSLNVRFEHMPARWTCRRCKIEFNGDGASRHYLAYPSHKLQKLPPPTKIISSSSGVGISTSVKSDILPA